MFGTEQLLASNGGFITFGQMEHSTLTVKVGNSKDSLSAITSDTFVRAHDIVRIEIAAFPNFKLMNPTLQGTYLGVLTNGSSVYAGSIVSQTKGKYLVVYEFEMPQDNLTLSYTTRTDIVTLTVGDLGGATLSVLGATFPTTAQTTGLVNGSKLVLYSDTDYTFLVNPIAYSRFKTLTITEANGTSKSSTKNEFPFATTDQNLTCVASLQHQIRVIYVSAYDNNYVVSEDAFSNGEYFDVGDTLGVIPEPVDVTAWDADAKKKYWVRPGATDGGVTFPSFVRNVTIAKATITSVTITLEGKLQTTTVNWMWSSTEPCRDSNGNPVTSTYNYRYGSTATIGTPNLSGYSNPNTSFTIGGYKTSYSMNVDGYARNKYTATIYWMAGDTHIDTTTKTFLYGETGSVASPNVSGYINPNNSVSYGGYYAGNQTIYSRGYTLALTPEVCTSVVGREASPMYGYYTGTITTTNWYTLTLYYVDCDDGTRCLVPGDGDYMPYATAGKYYVRVYLPTGLSSCNVRVTLYQGSNDGDYGFRYKYVSGTTAPTTYAHIGDRIKKYSPRGFFYRNSKGDHTYFYANTETTIFDGVIDKTTTIPFSFLVQDVTPDGYQGGNNSQVVAKVEWSAQGKTVTKWGWMENSYKYGYKNSSSSAENWVQSIDVSYS